MQQKDDFIERISKNIVSNIGTKNAGSDQSEETKSMLSKGNGMQKIESSSLQKSEREGSEMIQSEVSIVLSSPSLEAISATMTSIDSTVSDLRGYMRGMFANQPEPTIQKYDVDRVQTAVVCAKTMRELMQTKLEAIKLGRDIAKDQG
jgi:hypothetical protein